MPVSNKIDKPEGMGMTEVGLGCEKYRIDPTSKILPKIKPFSLCDIYIDLFEELQSGKNFYKNSRENP